MLPSKAKALHSHSGFHFLIPHFNLISTKTNNERERERERERQPESFRHCSLLHVLQPLRLDAQPTLLQFSSLQGFVQFLYGF
ncbi:hypothetical protein SDJN02_09528, partial [Cucurbita argyrosperma subsp. argyrosperma]